MLMLMLMKCYSCTANVKMTSLQVKAWLEEGKDVRFGDWKAADIEILNTFQLLSAKPVVYLVSNLECSSLFAIIFSI